MKFTHLGTTDTVTTCDCCGRASLKHTVAIESDATGIVYYGVVCASKALKIPTRDVKSAAKDADSEHRAVVAFAKAQHSKAYMAGWNAHMVEKLGRAITDFSGGVCVPSMVEALGGYTAAKGGFSFPAFSAPTHPAAQAA